MLDDYGSNKCQNLSETWQKLKSLSQKHGILSIFSRSAFPLISYLRTWLLYCSISLYCACFVLLLEWTSDLRHPSTLCLRRGPRGWFLQWMLHWWGVNGASTMREHCSHTLTAWTKSDRRHVSFFNSFVWLDRDSNPGHQVWLRVNHSISCFIVSTRITGISLLNNAFVSIWRKLCWNENLSFPYALGFMQF